MSASAQEAQALDEAFTAALSQCRRSAVHLEARDAYDLDDPDFRRWSAGERLDPVTEYRDWIELLAPAVARGVQFRRLRVVSVPVSAYVRFEHAVTAMNLAAGEQVRWLPRRDAHGLLLPACDGWVFDSAVVVLNHFDGDGHMTDEQRVDDPALAGRIMGAFEGAWERATPHDEFGV